MFRKMRQEPINFVELAREFVGKWVALHPETRNVLASGGSAKDVRDQAAEIGVSSPLILEVSDDYGGLAPWLA